MKMVRVEKWFMNSSRHAQRAINRAEKLLPFVEIKGNEKFIEVGCGNGAVSKHIAEEYHLNVTGTDVDPEQIQLAEKKTGQTSNLRFLVSSGTDLPFEENEFDIVLSFGVMHHISNWLDVFAEIKRVLKPKGHFVYFDLFYPRWLAIIGASFKHSYGITTLEDLSSFIEKNNFFVIYSSSVKHLMFFNHQGVYQKGIR